MMKNFWIKDDRIFMFYLHTSDFLEVGWANQYDQIMEDMKKKADVVFGDISQRLHYAGGIIYKAKRGVAKGELFIGLCNRRDEVLEELEYYVRFIKFGWTEVDKETYEKYADKWVSQMEEE
jgi:hypothetical protein